MLCSLPAPQSFYAIAHHSARQVGECTLDPLAGVGGVIEAAASIGRRPLTLKVGASHLKKALIGGNRLLAPSRSFLESVLYRTVLKLTKPDTYVSKNFRRRLMFKIPSITLVAVMTLGASAQAQTQTQVPADSPNPTPPYPLTFCSPT